MSTSLLRSCLSKYRAILQILHKVYCNKFFKVKSRIMAKLTLGYWDIRALGQPARMILEYAGADYEDKRYGFGPAPDYSMNAWFDIKFKLQGFDFPNLPYIIDGDVKLTESWAIYRYLGRKFDLFPKTEKATYEADMLQGIVQDILMGFVMPAFKLEPEEMKASVKEKNSPKLKQIEAFFNGRKFATGDQITFIDFPLFVFSDYHRILLPDLFNDYPNLKGFLERFESQDRIAAYFKSDRFKKFPVLGPMSKWELSRK